MFLAFWPSKLSAATSTPSGGFHAVIVILWWLLLHPSDEGGDVFMRPQSFPSVVVARQFFFCERGVNFSMADAMHGVRLASALALGQQMMLINAFARYQRPAAQRAIT